VELYLLLAEAAYGPIHRLEEIELLRLEPSLLDLVAEKLDRKLAWSLTRSDGLFYLDLGGQTYESALECTRLVPTEAEAAAAP